MRSEDKHKLFVLICKEGYGRWCCNLLLVRLITSSRFLLSSARSAAWEASEDWRARSTACSCAQIKRRVEDCSQVAALWGTYQPVPLTCCSYCLNDSSNASLSCKSMPMHIQYFAQKSNIFVPNATQTLTGTSLNAAWEPPCLIIVLMFLFPLGDNHRHLSTHKFNIFSDEVK